MKADTRDKHLLTKLLEIPPYLIWWETKSARNRNESPKFKDSLGVGKERRSVKSLDTPSNALLLTLQLRTEVTPIYLLTENIPWKGEIYVMTQRRSRSFTLNMRFIKGGYFFYINMNRFDLIYTFVSSFQQCSQIILMPSVRNCNAKKNFWPSGL